MLDLGSLVGTSYPESYPFDRRATQFASPTRVRGLHVLFAPTLDTIRSGETV